MGARGPDAIWRYVGALLVLLIAAEVAYLALTWDNDAEPDRAVDGSATETPASGPESPAASPSGDGVPKVKDQRRADFSKGDDLPDGSELVDTGDNEPGMDVGDVGLTHGTPGENGGAGYLETELRSDVRSVGFRVVFADDGSGSVALVASQTSMAEAAGNEAAAPAPGMRLVATPDSWTLTVNEAEQEEQVIGDGTFEADPGPATFRLVRDGETVWVVDPTGASTQVTDPLVEELQGPWASWGLVEGSPDETPAVIEAVWAG